MREIQNQMLRVDLYRILIHCHLNCGGEAVVIQSKYRANLAASLWLKSPRNDAIQRRGTVCRTNVAYYNPPRCFACSIVF